MMHFEEVVVTLVDTQNKPFRELNSQRADRGRKCEVYAPVNTEYKFLVKNNSDKRIKIDIDIDGSSVSGNGLILNAYGYTYIERFAEVDRRFKTSLKSGEGVADPTSPENGIIKVRVHKEKAQEIKLAPIVIEQHHHHHHDVWQHNSYPLHYTSQYPPTYGGVCRGMDASCSLGSTKGFNGTPTVATYSASVAPEVKTSGGILNNIKSLRASLPVAESLATVEGDASGQQFVPTTWNGEDQAFGEIVFTFFLKLASNMIDPEYVKYLELKQKFG
jgi:hypothetical protein